MSKKIGQALIEKGLLNQQQLTKALQTQLIHGGQLGTSLIELGFVDEATLGRTLAEILRLPHARAEMFEEIPKAILDTVPHEIVRQRRVIPIGIQDRSLHLAVIDPRNLSNLSSETGYRILPYLAPELRIRDAMECYYGIPRPTRFVKLTHRATAPEKAQRRRKPAPNLPAPVQQLRISVPVEEVPADLQALSQRMSNAQTRAELGEMILDYSVQHMDRAILFDVSGDHAVVANWKGVNLDHERMEGVSLPVTPDSIFALLTEGTFYEGPAPSDLECETFFDELGMPIPQELLFLPIYGDEHLEAVIYGDAGPDRRIDRPASYPLLLERISLAMKLLSLREQLCVAGP